MRVALRNNADKDMFVIGPAIDVLPKSSIVIGPDIMTAPGEINLKGKKIESKVINAPQVVKRNSDHNPRFWAVNL